MSNSISPYTGGNNQPAPLSFVPGTQAFRERRESAELELRRQRDVEEVAHRHGLDIMRTHNETVAGQAAVYGAGQVVAAAVHVTDGVASDIDAALVNASPVKQYAIESLMGAVLPELNRVASSHVAGLRRS